MYFLLLICILGVNSMKQEAFKLLQQELTKGGALGVENFDLYQSQGYRGLVASKDILKGQNILSIPIKLMITDNTLKESKILGSKIKKDIDDFENNKCHYYGVYLNEVRSNLKMSKLNRLYIENLPKDYDQLPFNYGPQLIEELQDKYLIQRVRVDIEELKKEYKSFQKKLGHKLSQKEHFWGYLACLTRTFNIQINKDGQEGPQMRAMIPFSDLVNTRYNINTEWYFDANTQAQILFANQDIKKGEEYFITYGGSSNRYDAFVYGFVDLTNINMEAEMDFCIDKDDPFFEMKVRLSHLDYDGCRTIMLNNRTDPELIVPFTNEMNILRMMHLNNKTVIVQNFLDSEPEENPLQLEPYRYRDEIQFMDWMILKFQQQIDSYPTTIEQDIELIGQTQDYTRKTVISLRLLTKKLFLDLKHQFQIAKRLFGMNLRDVYNELKHMDKTLQIQMKYHLDTMKTILG